MTARLGRLALLVVAVLAFGAASRARSGPTECWLLLARLDSGDALLFEITITDAGPGERNAAVIGRWATADGKLISFQKAKLGGEWSSGPGGRLIDLEKFQLDRRGPRARLSARKKAIRVELEFPLGAAPLAARELAGGKWTQELWASAVAVTATLWAEGRAEVKTRGRVALSHRLIDGPEAKHAMRRGEAFSLDSGASLYVAEIAAAKRRERWLVARDARGRVIADVLETGGAQPGLRAAPAELVLATASARGKLLAGEQLAAYDPLAELPAAIRFVLGLRLRSAWMSSPFDFRVGDGAAALALRGTALASYTFYD